ncbi:MULTISPECIES: high-potential iron-sulfur protein [unclassified Glaciimonas]|uniref:high-potential iron-sulfur protein n=2 Tax=unclassified Glaciimonas TaxID=2644401 RepID=UPI002B23A44B|nr:MULTISPECIES: high-potential iron-sulfur protein [unclassified Glaciimonas]
MNKTKPISRRSMLRQSTVMLGSIVIIPIAIYSRCANAGSASKGMLNYQDHPRDGQRCADCAAFRPLSTPDTVTGTCKIVAGPVNLSGWCMAFSSK